MEERLLGKTGLPVGIFGFGGIAIRDTPQKEAARIVSEVVERGVTFFDVAPSYGNAQHVLGSALKPHRARVSLACKTSKRTKDGALKDLRDSLRLLQTDYFDIYQLQAVSKEEVKTVLDHGGALEALVEARQEGLIRYIGFSSHYDTAALKLMQEFDFDTLLFPVNWASWLKNGVGQAALEEAARRNMGCIAIKALADRAKETEYDGYPRCWYRPIFDDPALADLALRFTLSRAVHTAISPADLRMLELGVSIVEKYQGVPPPLSSEEFEILRERAKGVALAVF
jgi:aryl-alcohol dehydrogenase-like predicted oxidoreductase